MKYIHSSALAMLLKSSPCVTARPDGSFDAFGVICRPHDAAPLDGTIVGDDDPAILAALSPKGRARVKGSNISYAFLETLREHGRRGDTLRKVLKRCVWIDRGSDYGLCLEWQGPDSGKPGRGRKAGRGHSYARMSFEGVTCAVHRIVWVTLNGYLPSKKQLDHLCNNRRCVLHCEPVTHKENQRRRDSARVLRSDVHPEHQPPRASGPIVGVQVGREGSIDERGFSAALPFQQPGGGARFRE